MQLQEMASEDSDATVAEGALSDRDCFSDVEGTGSPSFLNTSTVRDKEDIISNSSGDDEPMSPVFLPPKGIETLKSNNSEKCQSGDCAANTVDAPKDVVSGPTRTVQAAIPENPPSLDEISKKQSALLIELQHGGASQDTVACRASEIETHLKAIGLTNQMERKKLAVAHAALSKEQSQEEVAKRSRSIRLQLVNLASKQKQLLQCFVKQKEITSQLSTLNQAPAETTLTSVPQVTSQPSQMLTGPTPTSSYVNVPLPQQHNHQHSQMLTGVTPTSSHVIVPQVAFPNLVKHLKTTSANASKSTIPCQQSMEVATAAQQYPENHSQTSVVTTTTTATVTMTTEPATQQTQGKLPSDLAQCVPMDMLIKHKIIQPDVGCLTCTLMGCEFRATLLGDGSLEAENGKRFQTPQQWLGSCWAALGHQKKLTRKQSYKTVLYKGMSLLQHCEQYSLKQVSSYLSKKQNTDVQKNPDNTQTSVPELLVTDTRTHSAHQPLQPPSSPMQHSGLVPIIELLRSGRVFLVQSMPETSLDVPPVFWERDDIHLASQLRRQIEADLSW